MSIKPVCVVQAPAAVRSGYGDHARGIIKSLIKYDKFDVKIVPMPWGGCPSTALDEDTEENKLIKSKFVQGQLTQQPDLHIQISIPNEFQPQGKYNMGITAGIESTLAKGEWIEGLNRMNMNIVPSQHAKKVFIDSKFKKKEKNGMETPLEMAKPMEVLFEGYHEPFVNPQKSSEVDSVLNSFKEDFCFLFVGHWLQGGVGSDRKDIGMLIKTFCEVFKNAKDAPALILKTSGATFSEMDKDETLKKIKKSKRGVSGKLPNIYLIHGDMTENEIAYLMNHKKVKAHVNFTHGEGFGRPLLEASLSKKPVITSNWSGHVDFLDPKLAVMLPGQLAQVPRDAANEWIIKESQWFNITYSVAAQKLYDVHRNYDKYLPNAEKLSAVNKKKFSLDAMDEEFHKILDQYLPKFTSTASINLPQLKKSGSGLPQLKKAGGDQSIKLPTLKKRT